MTFYDVFNGDADGICALTQLRRHAPKQTELVTGVKRDIALLENLLGKVVSGDELTVLDISMDKNTAPLQQLLSDGAKVFYCDHHFPGEVPSHNNLYSIINTASDVCTSLLINHHLQGAYIDWAVVGTFGDNLDKSADGLAKTLDLSPQEREQLRNLGIYLNYNGYGSDIVDLHFHPKELFALTSQFDSARQFLLEDQATFATLEAGYHDDMLSAQNIKPEFADDTVALFVLPNAAWARRVSGVFSNELANQFRDRAHAVLTTLPTADKSKDEHYLVSIRAPLNNKVGADEVCRQFDTGGGRAAAAGINRLPANDVQRLVQALQHRYG